MHGDLHLEVVVELFDLRLHRLLLLVRLFALHAVDASLQLLDLIVFVVDDLLLLQGVVVQHVDLAVQVTDGCPTALVRRQRCGYVGFGLRYVDCVVTLMAGA